MTLKSHLHLRRGHYCLSQACLWCNLIHFTLYPTTNQKKRNPLTEHWKNTLWTGHFLRETQMFILTVSSSPTNLYLLSFKVTLFIPFFAFNYISSTVLIIFVAFNKMSHGLRAKTCLRVAISTFQLETVWNTILMGQSVEDVPQIFAPYCLVFA